MFSIYWLHKWNKQSKIDHAKDIDTEIPIYNLVYGDRI